jgi:hypothetical protein
MLHPPLRGRVPRQADLDAPVITALRLQSEVHALLLVVFGVAARAAAASGEKYRSAACRTRMLKCAFGSRQYEHAGELSRSGNRSDGAILLRAGAGDPCSVSSASHPRLGRAHCDRARLLVRAIHAPVATPVTRCLTEVEIYRGIRSLIATFEGAANDALAPQTLPSSAFTAWRRAQSRPVSFTTADGHPSRVPQRSRG